MRFSPVRTRHVVQRPDTMQPIARRYDGIQLECTRSPRRCRGGTGMMSLGCEGSSFGRGRRIAGGCCSVVYGLLCDFRNLRVVLSCRSRLCRWLG